MEAKNARGDNGLTDPTCPPKYSPGETFYIAGKSRLKSDVLPVSIRAVYWNKRAGYWLYELVSLRDGAVKLRSEDTLEREKVTRLMVVVPVRWGMAETK